MAATLEIEPLGMHWLDADNEAGDLCLHGGIRVAVSGEALIDTGAEDYALSTGALHLLRTLDRDHTPDRPISEHLVPHCGHVMVVDGESGSVTNVGCAAGVNWWVRHEGSDVVLTFADADARVPAGEWRRAVCAFSDVVAAFYDAGGKKRPLDALAQEWYEPFRAEWERLRRSESPGGECLR